MGVDDTDGSIVIVAVTTSTNFEPLVNAMQKQYGGGDGDAFVTVLRSDGRNIMINSAMKTLTRKQ
jgi:hypothetical protein